MISISNYLNNPKHTVTEERIAKLAAAQGFLLNRQDLHTITGWLKEPIEVEDGITNGADLCVRDTTITTRHGAELSDSELWVHIERNLPTDETVPEQNPETQKAFLAALQKLATNQVTRTQRSGYTNIDPELHLALLQSFIFDILHNAEGGEDVMPLTYSISATPDFGIVPTSPVTFTNPADTDAHERYRDVRDKVLVTKLHSKAFVTT